MRPQIGANINCISENTASRQPVTRPCSWRSTPAGSRSRSAYRGRSGKTIPNPRRSITTTRMTVISAPFGAAGDVWFSGVSAIEVRRGEGTTAGYRRGLPRPADVDAASLAGLLARHNDRNHYILHPRTVLTVRTLRQSLTSLGLPIDSESEPGSRGPPSNVEPRTAVESEFGRGHPDGLSGRGHRKHPGRPAPEPGQVPGPGANAGRGDRKSPRGGPAEFEFRLRLHPAHVPGPGRGVCPSCGRRFLLAGDQVR